MIDLIVAKTIIDQDDLESSCAAVLEERKLVRV
jgi:hypothetical protein